MAAEFGLLEHPSDMGVRARGTTRRILAEYTGVPPEEVRFLYGHQGKPRLEFLTQHHGVGLLTGEVGAGKSTAARVFTAALNTSL